MRPGVVDVQNKPSCSATNVVLYGNIVNCLPTTTLCYIEQICSVLRRAAIGCFLFRRDVSVTYLWQKWGRDQCHHEEGRKIEVVGNIASFIPSLSLSVLTTIVLLTRDWEQRVQLRERGRGRAG